MDKRKIIPFPLDSSTSNNLDFLEQIDKEPRLSKENIESIRAQAKKLQEDIKKFKQQNDLYAGRFVVYFIDLF